MTAFEDEVHIAARREADKIHRGADRKREMNEEEIYTMLASVRKVLGTESADEKDRAIFTLHEQCVKFRRALEQIASFPRTGQPEELAAKALDWPGIRLGGKFEVPNKEIEAAVNRGLAVTHLSDLPTGARVMRKGGVPLEVGLRVLLHPESRRTTDWRDASSAFSARNAKSPMHGNRRDH